MCLTLKMHVGLVQEDQVLHIGLLFSDRAGSFLGLVLKDISNESHINELERAVHCVHKVIPDVRDDTAKRAGEPRSEGHHNSRDAQLPR